jgi:pilus assembly protein Flp/PilA
LNARKFNPKLYVEKLEFLSGPARLQRGRRTMARHVSRYAHGVVRFLREEDGPAVTEYAIMIALIVLVSVAVISSMGTKVNTTYETLRDNVPSAP